jgi:hypothetical protein
MVWLTVVAAKDDLHLRCHFAFVGSFIVLYITDAIKKISPQHFSYVLLVLARVRHSVVKPCGGSAQKTKEGAANIRPMDLDQPTRPT